MTRRTPRAAVPELWLFDARPMYNRPMLDPNPSCISHVSIGTNHFDRAVAFYDAVMTTLGCRRVMEHPGAVAYGKRFPEFWVQTPIDGHEARAGNGTHVGFLAHSRAAVDAFHAAALRAGG